MVRLTDQETITTENIVCSKSRIRPVNKENKLMAARVEGVRRWASGCREVGDTGFQLGNE